MSTNSAGQPGTEEYPVIIAARLSRKSGKDRNEIGIDTQDARAREWCEANGYQVVEVVSDWKTGRSAPWDRKNLKAWVTRPELMQRYKGVVAFANDRLSRGAPEDEMRIRQWATDNGKRLMIVNGPQWPPRDDADFWSWTANAKQAEKEWESIRERILRATGEIRARGFLVGSVPWGYDVKGERYNKLPEPNATGREWIPQIFERIASGDSLAEVAFWLNRFDLKSAKWSHTTVAQVVHNRAYMGTRMKGSGVPDMEIPAIIDGDLWKRANDRLKNTMTGRRKPVKTPPAFLSGVLFCQNCQAPMYRIHAARGFSYRCAGHYPERKGCGVMIDLAETDAEAFRLMSNAVEPFTEWRKTEGENHEAELAKIALELSDLPKRGLPDDEEDSERRRLRNLRDEVAAKPKAEDVWREVDTGETYGERFRRLDDEGRRKMMLDTMRFFARKGPDGPDLQMMSGRLVTTVLRHGAVQAWAKKTGAKVVTAKMLAEARKRAESG
jgi:DNA invertase Pin-like site-specific DNA recombinase